MARNTELETAIEKDPDDEDAYFVYGDWLQTEEDPRGELIALQAAARRDPGDEAIAKRVAEVLAQNRHVLLGDLASRVDVAWHLGFVRHVRVEAQKNPDDALEALREMLEHPSGRFVQSIAFAQTRGVDPEKVVKLLLDLGAPATLSELRIGGNWDSANEPRLREAFPRLNRTLDAEWRQILDTLGEQRAMDLKFDADKLPRLEPKPDVQADGISPEHILLGLKLDLDKRRGVGIVAAMKRSFTAESLDRFAIALGQQFIAAGAPTNMRWGFQAIGQLGGDQAVAWIATHVGEWTHARAVQGAELLGQIRSNLALWELYAMSMDPTLMRARREGAGETLARIAGGRAMDIDRLLDRSVPPVAPETKQRSTRNTSTRETTTFDARSRVRDAAIRRLQAHMIDGRRIPYREFLHYFVRHPVIAPLVQRVLWATYDGVDVETTFRVTADGTALDAGGDTVDLDGATIGVLHPAELDAASRRSTLKEWTEIFDDEELEPLFSQLDRQVHELRDVDRGESITRFKLRSMGFDHMRTNFEQVLDWAPDREDMDGGPITIGWTRFYARDRVEAYAAVSGGAIGEVTVTRIGVEVAFSTLHPVTASEIVGALERATTRAKPTAATADSDEVEGDIQKGTRVKIVRGANRLREGVVFWLGDGNNGARCGIRTADNETLWANVADVRVDNLVVDEDSEDDDAATARPKAKSKAEEKKAEAKKAEAKNALSNWRRDDSDDDDDDDDSDDDDTDGNLDRDNDDDDAGDRFIAKAEASSPKRKKVVIAKGTKPDASGGLEKGTKVRWEKGRNSGTGVVFWIGKNKFGEGMRAGLKDDETGETVWADADDCKPID